jgi:hypothetical protein
MKEKLHPRVAIQENAKRMVELHKRVHETSTCKNKSKEAWDEWKQACAEFHSQYDALAFPGGYETGLKEIQAGDFSAIENALAFLEVRPYFFRSQYMRTKLIRLLKHAQLSRQQAERFQKFLRVPPLGSC